MLSRETEQYNLSWCFSFEEGSPWSASEPSIEPEGMSTAGVEENYHRNMSWLHVSRRLRKSPEINFFWHWGQICEERTKDYTKNIHPFQPLRNLYVHISAEPLDSH